MTEPQVRFPAVFMRGGSSKGVFFHRRDLPEDRALWDPIFLAAIGSPDAYGRQLDGMGGGYSSVSKIVVMAPSERADADVDYTFGQVTVSRREVHYRTTCGNLMAAAAHFALDDGLVVARDGDATVRIFDTNTRKSVVARFATEGGIAAVEGGLAVVGVSGSGAPVRLDFLDPGGAGTGRLLPSGAPCDVFDVPGLGRVDVSLVDAANPCAFVRAEQFGVQGSESPADLNADTMLVTRLEQIRRQAGVIMGFGPTPESIAPKNSPKVACRAAARLRPFGRPDSIRRRDEPRGASPHLRQLPSGPAADQCHVRCERGADRGHARARPREARSSVAAPSSGRHAVRRDPGRSRCAAGLFGKRLARAERHPIQHRAASDGEPCSRTLFLSAGSRPDLGLFGATSAVIVTGNRLIPYFICLLPPVG